MKGYFQTALAFLISLGTMVTSHAQSFKTISTKSLKDKIAGAWAGKMIGVTYGAPTEFHALGKTFDEPILWTPKDTRGSMWQDDIYVQLTFMMTMDRYGMDCDAKKFQEMFAKAGYMLWHANVQARKNYYDSIFPPYSGSPEYNSHADDIDFQIEADYIGLMCPGMPNTSMHMADKIGHIMNYGDGVYGGIFVSSLYTQAYFENSMPLVIENALKTIPAQSDYAKTIADVILLHKKFPNNWREAWKLLNEKWGHDQFCEAGSDFNIDAKLNGAFIVMGLLYGEGIPLKTLEIATRCGQDSDCNPSSAMAVLALIIGFDKLPAEMKDGVSTMADSLFINTDYSFKKAVEKTFTYACQLIVANGGFVNNDSARIKVQEPVPAPFEIAFPNTVVIKKIPVFEKASWSFSGKWQQYKKNNTDQSVFSGNAGDEAIISFTGTGISIDGNWVKDGGKAEVYLDDKFMREMDTYYFYNEQEHENITLWHVTGLPEKQHTLRIVVKGSKKPESAGSNLYLTKAMIYKTGKKKSELYQFPFKQ